MTENDRLTAAFAALTGDEGGPQRPFRWQMRFLNRLLKADLPRVVDVPTGLGKTSVGPASSFCATPQPHAGQRRNRKTPGRGTFMTGPTMGSRPWKPLTPNAFIPFPIC